MGCNPILRLLLKSERLEGNLGVSKVLPITCQVRKQLPSFVVDNTNASFELAAVNGGKRAKSSKVPRSYARSLRVESRPQAATRRRAAPRHGDLQLLKFTA